MKIACNYYLETEQLLDERIIDLDYFKYPGLVFQMEIMKDLDAFESFCNKLTAKRPILLHGLYPSPHDLSSPSLQTDFNNEVANRLIKITGTPGLSLHPALSKIPDDVPFEKTFRTIVENAIFIKEQYADLEFVSLENCDNIQWGELIKPDRISRLLSETGCDFLLDISHAYCASRWLNIPFIEYLKMLPLDKTVEIHINGWITTDSSVMCHTKIHDEGYHALKEVLNYCSPKIITVEYGRDYDRIGSGCPLMSPDKINDEAKKEIVEQIIKIQELIQVLRSGYSLKF